MSDRVDVHIHVHGDSDRRLDHIERLLHQLIERDTDMALDLSALQASVDAETQVNASAITLLNNLADQIAAAAGDPAAVQALADQVRSNAQALGDAVAANTPAAPPADTPPADTPPADVPPVDAPPADQPPADVPPADQPPADVPVDPAPADNGDQTPGE